MENWRLLPDQRETFGFILLNCLLRPPIRDDSIGDSYPIGAAHGHRANAGASCSSASRAVPKSGAIEPNRT
jgi:hypothetical protein